MTRRRGFTLLEMILSTMIAVLLMVGLYSALEGQFFHAQVGREVLEESVLARSILMRISNDVLNNLGPLDPKLLPEGSTALANVDAALAATTAESGTPTETETETESGSMSAAPSTTSFNMGIQGGSDVIILSVNRAQRNWWTPRGLTVAPAMGSGLRRISYWMDRNLGLCRQELMHITGDEAQTSPTQHPNPQQFVIAPEVQNLTFEYFDGVTWQPTWTGDQVGADGDTPIGPPSAIRINLTLRTNPMGTALNPNPDPVFRNFSHVVAVPAGNNFPTTQTGGS